MKTNLFLGLLCMSIIGISTVFGQSHRGNRHNIGMNQSFYQSYQYQIDQAYFNHFLTIGERQTLVRDLDRLYERERALHSGRYTSHKDLNPINRDKAHFERKFSILVNNGNRGYAQLHRGNSCDYNGYQYYDNYFYNDFHNHGKNNHSGGRNRR